MKVELPGVDAQGNHRTNGPSVQFSFEHRGQAFVRMRVSWDMDKPPIVHPLPSGSGQPKPRQIEKGKYIVSVEINASDLPGLPSKTIDSDLLINGVLVLRVTGEIPDGQNTDRDGALFRLIVA